MKNHFLIALFMLTLTACGGGDQPGSASVSYSISGDGTTAASLTYANATGGTEQKTVTLPTTVPTSGTYSIPPGQFLYISAQNQSSSGSVTVKIMINGNVWKQSTSSGAYAIATASGGCC